MRIEVDYDKKLELPFDIPKIIYDVCFLGKNDILNKIREYKIVGFFADGDTLSPVYEDCDGYHELYYRFNYFDTKEEAEQKLNELNNEN